MILEFEDEELTKIPGTPEQLKMRRKWVDALRSGKYKQTQGLLKDVDGGFCCLGVLCDLVHPESWNSNNAFLIEDRLYEDLPPLEIMEEIIDSTSLSNIGIDIIPNVDAKYIHKGKRVVFSTSENTHAYFSSLNDDYNLSFDEIADVIEHFYEVEPKEQENV